MIDYSTICFTQTTVRNESNLQSTTDSSLSGLDHELLMVELSSPSLNTHSSVRSACQHEVPKPGLKYGQSARRSLGMTNTANTNDSLTEWFISFSRSVNPEAGEAGKEEASE